MKKLPVSRSTYRLISSAIVLALMLVALTFSTPPASAFECHVQQICGQGCVGWDEVNGCVSCQVCCGCDTEFSCHFVNDRVCDYTY
jgi:hypothetical protein